ncbi:MAG: hypothetical protein ACOC71_07390 [Hyphomicrobiales bacterium]
MDLRNPAMTRLTFLVAWTTACGLPSGFFMGLFFLVFQDGYRKGVLPPQQGLREALPRDLQEAFPTVARLASQVRDSDR